MYNVGIITFKFAVVDTNKLQQIYNFTMSNELPEKTYKQENN